MKRGSTILCLGLAVALVGYFTLYFRATAAARAAEQAALCCKEAPELMWLKQQFNLNDAEFKRISELHAGYLPQCREICGRIATKNGELRTMLAATNQVTPDMEKKLAEVAQLRAQCQKNMLDHFYAVSRAMPPEQGRRYLDWIQGQTIGGADCSSNAACHVMP